MSQSETIHSDPIRTLRRLVARVLALVQNRVELLLVELQEERVHVINAPFLTAVIIAFGVFTLAMAACALSIAVWNEFGLKGLWVLSGLGLAGTLLTYWRLRIRLKHWPLLPETLAQFRKDRDSWEGR